MPSGDSGGPADLERGLQEPLLFDTSLTANLSLPNHPPHQAILEGLLIWSEDSKNRFRLKTRTVVERLVRRCGQEAVAAACPEGEGRLVSHIRKQNARKERRRGGSEAGSEVRARRRGVCCVCRLPVYAQGRGTLEGDTFAFALARQFVLTACYTN